MGWEERLETNPEVLTGKPVIRGTRIAVEQVLDLLAQGWSHAQIIENYPGINEDDVIACLAYAAERIKSERVYSLPSQ